MAGVPVVNISGVVCYGDAFRPLSVQVDELNPGGRVTSIDFQSKVAKDDALGTFDANDEIVFMLRDAGTACAPDRLARAQGTLVEVRIQAAFLKEPLFVYLLAGNEAALPAGQPLVRFDAKREIVYGRGYTWGYDTKNPFVSNRMTFADFHGREQENLLDRLKVRINAKSVGNLVKIKLNENDIEAHLEGMRIGPVRITREMSAIIHSVPGFNITALLQFQHFDRLWRANVRFKMPSVAAMFVSSLDMSFMHDFTDLRGLRFATSFLPGGILIDGRMLDAEKIIEFGAEPWFMISGNGLNQITSIDLDQSLKLKTDAVFSDDQDVSDPPESVKGGLPIAGYHYSGWENLRAKWYAFGANIAFLGAFPEGGGSGYYRTFRTPLEIETHKIETAN